MPQKKKNNSLLDFLSQNDNYKPYLDKYYIIPKKMNNILNNLKLYKESTVFLNKVTKKEAPDYHKIIKKPIDFATIQKKIGKYYSYNEFKEDLDLIWSNCYTYNAGPYYIYCADTMKKAVRTQEIPRLSLSQDVDYEPYSFEVEGRESVKDKRNELKRVIVKIIKENGFEIATKKCIEILSDLLSQKILRELRNGVNME
ncbi:Transcriptional activator SPT7 [Nosema bombycis CQ1]|uniref:Transcriptional activator SPT7 n=1 Tax=Nosema bombycis (strain CQ1 / CVCC 102059) TaxID=578461 RepID=R0MEI1_NOSB1|nr:Transcriptional activator SPT7 [Nosema bombycis CQ1]|eukprot:EOB12520.1 Transcriptional activator SPT7 [Nosema bombycis CQ1]